MTPQAKLEELRARIARGDPTARPMDLILLDLVMPRMDGKAVLGRLKEEPEVGPGRGPSRVVAMRPCPVLVPACACLCCCCCCCCCCCRCGFC